MIEKEEQINIKEIYGKESILQVSDFIKNKNRHLPTKLKMKRKRLHHTTQFICCSNKI